MGWTLLLDKNDNEIGHVGDKVWDIMSEAFIKVIEEYQKTWGRQPYSEEIAQIIEFAFPGHIEVGKSELEKCKMFNFNSLQDVLDLLPDSKIYCSPDGPYDNHKPSFAIGWQQDLSVGIFGGVITPYFPSHEALLEYCRGEEGQRVIDEAGKEAFGTDWGEMLEERV